MPDLADVESVEIQGSGSKPPVINKVGAVCTHESSRIKQFEHSARWTCWNNLRPAVFSTIAFSLIAASIVYGATASRTVGNSISPAVCTYFEDAYRPPKGYVAYRTAQPIQIDGRIDDEAWEAAPWTDDFVDIEGDRRAKPRFRTRAKMLWDDVFLYIAVELEEPHVQGSFTEHDSYIFHEDNDFEVFIDPDGNNHNYAELEMNALNTTWDLRLNKPYRDGGTAEDAWEIFGLRTAVHIDGTINDPSDVDRGWTIEISIPWGIARSLNAGPGTEIGTVRGEVPKDGDQWRINFSRVEWQFDIEHGKYQRRKARREDNWVWSPQWAVNMHQPETWGVVQFSTAPPGRAEFRPDPAGPAKHLLHRIANAQRAYRAKHQHYASTLEALGLAGIGHETLAKPPRLEANSDQFQAGVDVRLPDGTEQSWRIRQDSLVWREP